jgi:hypothetical protein
MGCIQCGGEEAFRGFPKAIEGLSTDCSRFVMLVSPVLGMCRKINIADATT